MSKNVSSSTGGKAALRPKLRHGALAPGVATLITVTASVLGCEQPPEPPSAAGGVGLLAYTLVCDRVGAQALREDTTGASYRNLCHPLADGSFQDKVDESLLVPLSKNARRVDGSLVPLDTQKEERSLLIARVEAVAHRRTDIIDSIEAILPKMNLPASTSRERQCATPKTSLRKELLAATGRMLDLFADGTLPEVIHSAGELIDTITTDSEAQQALARVANRRGYQPTGATMGLLQPVAAYPRLPNLASSLLTLLSSGNGKPLRSTSVSAKGHSAYRALLQTAHMELLAVGSPLPKDELRVSEDPAIPGRIVLSRPREVLELAKHLLFAQDPSFGTGDAQLIVRRDNRGTALVSLRNNIVPAPFVDTNRDGLPELDAFGLFVTQGVQAPTPFSTSNSSSGSRDTLGRALQAGQPVYQYLDASRTLMSSLMGGMRQLFANPSGGQTKLGNMIDMLGALPPLAGKRNDGPTSVRSYTTKPIAQPNNVRSTQVGATRDATLNYSGFQADSSPVVDLVYALGQLVAQPAIDDLLALSRKLAVENPDALARLVGTLAEVFDAVRRHPEASVPDGSTFADDMIEMFGKMTQEPELLEALMTALADDRVLKLQKLLPPLLTFKDDLTYNRAANAPTDSAIFNGPLFNKTTGKLVADPANMLTVPVDRSQPDTGANRSVMQRFLHLAHDTLRVSACSKEGSVLHIKIRFPPDLPLSLPIAFDYPTSKLLKAVSQVIGCEPMPNPAPACGVFKIDKLYNVVAKTVVSGGQPPLNDILGDPCLNKLFAPGMRSTIINKLMGFVPLEKYIAEMSGIRDLNPLDFKNLDIGAGSRFLFFDTAYKAYPESAGVAGDLYYPNTERFIGDMMDPLPTSLCPVEPVTTLDGTVIQVNKCRRFEDTLRGRHNNALFGLPSEILPTVWPLAEALAKHSPPTLLADMTDAIHWHYGSTKQSRSECDPSVSRTDPRWCSQDGLSSFEPIIAEIAEGDAFAAIHDLMGLLAKTKVPHCEAYSPTTKLCERKVELTGIQILAEAARVLADPNRWNGLRDIHGQARGKRNDGREISQVTPLSLVLNAVRGIDRAVNGYAAANPDDKDLKARFSDALSGVFDTFLAIDGKGRAARFKNQYILKTIPLGIDIIRAQIQANCPAFGRSPSCDWAQKKLPGDIKDTLEGPLFASLTDLVEVIRHDATARAELQDFAAYMLDAASNAQLVQSALGSTADLLEFFEDRTNLRPVLGVLSRVTASPSNASGKSGAEPSLAETATDLLARVFGRIYDKNGAENCAAETDPHGVNQVVLQHLLAPKLKGQAPLDVLLSVIQQVNRANPKDTGPLSDEDIRHIAQEVSDFILNPRTGLERVNDFLHMVTFER